ncbi:MAG TPA: SgcJ/EcaC family oxidoreductase [Thermoanaerobaculia bacterium]|nr:SgcJ/EcaC family oxidoreductase [Thermoanaerobaculia bacterium]
MPSIVAQRRSRRAPLFAICAFALLWAAAVPPTPAARQIEAFNQKFMEAGIRMDNAAVMALYGEDSVSLLPGMAPMVGKKTIAAWLDGVVAQMPGYRATKNDLDCRDIQVCGDWATEWCLTHQVVQPPDGKPPIETHGKMLLVLHRENAGEWRIEREMWNNAPAATSR